MADPVSKARNTEQTVRLRDGQGDFDVAIVPNWLPVMGQLLRREVHPLNVDATMRKRLIKRGLLVPELHDWHSRNSRPPHGGLTPRGRLVVEHFGYGYGSVDEPVWLRTATDGVRVALTGHPFMRFVDLYWHTPTDDAVVVIHHPNGTASLHLLASDEAEAIQQVCHYRDTLEVMLGRFIDGGQGNQAKYSVTTEPTIYEDPAPIDATVERLCARGRMAMPISSRRPDLFGVSESGVLRVA